MLTLSLLLVVATATLPSIAGWQARMPLNQATAQTQQGCQQARIEAIRSGTTWFLQVPELSAHWCSGPIVTPATDSIRTSFETTPGIESIHVTDLSGQTLTRLLFYPNGTTSSARIVITDRYGRDTTLMLDRLTGLAVTEITQ